MCYLENNLRTYFHLKKKKKKVNQTDCPPTLLNTLYSHGFYKILAKNL